MMSKDEAAEILYEAFADNTEEREWDYGDTITVVPERIIELVYDKIFQAGYDEGSFYGAQYGYNTRDF